jgi:hypothetical protein
LCLFRPEFIDKSFMDCLSLLGRRIDSIFDVVQPFVHFPAFGVPGYFRLLGLILVIQMIGETALHTGWLVGWKWPLCFLGLGEVADLAKG